MILLWSVLWLQNAFQRVSWDGFVALAYCKTWRIMMKTSQRLWTWNTTTYYTHQTPSNNPKMLPFCHSIARLMGFSKLSVHRPLVWTSRWIATRPRTVRWFSQFLPLAASCGIEYGEKSWWWFSIMGNISGERREDYGEHWWLVGGLEQFFFPY